MILKGGRNKQSTTKHNKASQSLTAQEPPHKKTNIPFEMFAHVYAIPAHPTNRRRYARTCAAPVSFARRFETAIYTYNMYVFLYVLVFLYSVLSFSSVSFFRTILLYYLLRSFSPSKIFY